MIYLRFDTAYIHAFSLLLSPLSIMRTVDFCTALKIGDDEDLIKIFRHEYCLKNIIIISILMPV